MPIRDSLEKFLAYHMASRLIMRVVKNAAGARGKARSSRVAAPKWSPLSDQASFLPYMLGMKRRRLNRRINLSQ